MGHHFRLYSVVLVFACGLLAACLSSGANNEPASTALDISKDLLELVNDDVPEARNHINELAASIRLENAVFQHPVPNAPLAGATPEKEAAPAGGDEPKPAAKAPGVTKNESHCFVKMIRGEGEGADWDVVPGSAYNCVYVPQVGWGGDLIIPEWAKAQKEAALAAGKKFGADEVIGLYTAYIQAKSLKDAQTWLDDFKESEAAQMVAERFLLKTTTKLTPAVIGAGDFLLGSCIQDVISTYGELQYDSLQYSCSRVFEDEKDKKELYENALDGVVLGGSSYGLSDMRMALAMEKEGEALNEEGKLAVKTHAAMMQWAAQLNPADAKLLYRLSDAGSCFQAWRMENEAYRNIKIVDKAVKLCGAAVAGGNTSSSMGSMDGFADEPATTKADGRSSSRFREAAKPAEEKPTRAKAAAPAGWAAAEAAPAAAKAAPAGWGDVKPAAAKEKPSRWGAEKAAPARAARPDRKKKGW